ncbi:MAG: glycosyltransferase family 39 protein [Chloroflexi bacterium]|nr:glycosyltransferase family 39 protein [Chloroflexota bacterium]
MPWALAALLLVALGLRLYGIDWDRGLPFSPHPDERHISYVLTNPPPQGMGGPWSWGKLLDVQASPLNPHNFNYGSLPIYLTKLFYSALSQVKESQVWRDLPLVGRGLAALFDVGTVLLLYLLATRLYGRRAGLLAAAFVAFAVIHIQNSHYATVDTTLAFFIVLTLYFCIRVAGGQRGWSRVGVGAALGLALATKVSALPLLLPVALACYMGAFPGDKQPLRLPKAAELKKALLSLGLALAVAGAVNFLAQPFAYLDWRTLRQNLGNESAVMRGTLDVPYTRQFIDTPAYLYPLQQLTVWGLGLPLGIALWAGLAYTVTRIRQWKKGDLLLLSWTLPFFLIVGSFHAKWLRNYIPLTPVLAVMAGGMFSSWFGWAGQRHRWAIKVVIGAVLTSAVLYSLAFLHIYSQPHPSLRASQWLEQNASRGSLLLKESVWDEALPFLDGYRWGNLELYDEDTPAKTERIANLLSQANYLVIWSNRLYGTIPRLPERYPTTARYYSLLFSEDLGYRLAYSASSYPSLLGITLMDDTFRRPGLPHPEGLRPPGGLVINGGYADESYSVYTHPKVMIFHNEGHYSSQELEGLLAGAAPSTMRGLLSPEDAATNRKGGTWAEIFSPRSWSNRFLVLAWLLLVEAIFLTALPLALALFRPLADRGYLLAKALGILLVGYLAWLAASLHVLPFSRGSIFLALLAVALISGYVLMQDRTELISFVKSRWRLLLLEEVLFLGAFALFLGLRMWNPDLWHPFRGGEKPMDFAYLNAIIKSSYMPPYDPWFAEGFINYYYFGHFLLAVLIKATGILPEVAFNLAVPLLFALTVTGAFSLAFNLVRAKGGKMSSAFLTGGAGVLFVALLGNLDGAVQLLQGLGKVLQGLPFPPFDYWRSSRMIVSGIGPNSGFEITEFPFFTALFADLHAHFIALPFTLLALGLALALILRKPSVPGLGGWRERLERNHLLLLFVAALVLGGLRAINTWDFPTYFLAVVASLFLLERSRGRTLSLGVFLWVGIEAALVYGLSYVLYLPFHQNYQLFYLGVRGSLWKTPLPNYLAIYGLFLFLLISWWFRETGRAFTHRLSLGGGRWWRMLPVGVLFIALSLGLAALLMASRRDATALLVPLLALISLLAWNYWRKGELIPLVATGLAALGLTLTLTVDFLVLKGDINRQNTVFKFYLQAWVLLALASSFAGWRLLGDALEHFKARQHRRLWVLWLGGLGVLLASSLIYPIDATPVRLGDRFQAMPPTLNGMAFMEGATYYDEKGPIGLKWDLQAIRWLRENVSGSPMIAEGVTPDYSWGSRISVYTGLPTIVGWGWHQEQQRWGYQEQVKVRQQDVRALFADPSPKEALALLRKYNVSYIYVGTLERLYYPGDGLAKFEAMAGEQLEMVYPNSQESNPEVKIYKVKGVP